MKLTIDTETNTATLEDGGVARQVPLYSREGFEIGQHPFVVVQHRTVDRTGYVVCGEFRLGACVDNLVKKCLDSTDFTFSDVIDAIPRSPASATATVWK